MPTAEDTDETARIMPALKLNFVPTYIDPTQVSPSWPVRSSRRGSTRTSGG